MVYRVSRAYHDLLQFPATGMTGAQGSEIFQSLAATLQAYRLSFEYIQDYVGIYGLKMWHEELSRVINYNVEAECNRYLKKKVYDRTSTYQSRAIPIPRFSPPANSTSINFMGRLLHALFLMTDPHESIYAFQCLSWFHRDGTEGVHTYSLIYLVIIDHDDIKTYKVLHDTVSTIYACPQEGIPLSLFLLLLVSLFSCLKYRASRQ